MKVVVLAGGYGTRISEETGVIPKPLVEIGGRPILWHILKHYAAYGLTDFVICCGYKGERIKRWFLDVFHAQSDFTVDLVQNRIDVHRTRAEPWRVTLVDTGLDTMTGGRLKRIADYVGDEAFCMTYGDGVSDVDLTALVAHHRAQGRLATVTAVMQPGRFGALELDGDAVAAFREKGPRDGGLINGGYFVLEPQCLDLIEGDETVWEQGPLQQLAALGQLGVWRHEGFWQNMDTLRDKIVLQKLWDAPNPPWRVWPEAEEGRWIQPPRPAQPQLSVVSG